MSGNAEPWSGLAYQPSSSFCSWIYSKPSPVLKGATVHHLVRARQFLQDALSGALCKDGGQCIHPWQKISSLGLKVREIHALRYFGVETVHDFLKLDLTGRNYIPNCGNKTLDALLQAQQTLRQEIGIAAESRHRAETQATSSVEALSLTPVRRPLAPRAWQALPLFSNRPSPGLDAAGIHRSFRPDSPSATCGSPRNSWHCRRKRSSNVGRPIVNHAPRLRQAATVQKKCYPLNPVGGRGILRGRAASQREIATQHAIRGGFSLLTLAAHHRRCSPAIDLEKRLGARHPPQTLEAVGKRLHLSRERVRQLEKERCGAFAIGEPPPHCNLCMK